jgi:hypothetical protein
MTDLPTTTLPYYYQNIVEKFWGRTRRVGLGQRLNKKKDDVGHEAAVTTGSTCYGTHPPAGQKGTPLAGTPGWGSRIYIGQRDTVLMV